MTKERITAAVCAYTERRWSDICQAVQSLRDQSHPPMEIMIVIDHNDALLARARDAFPDAVVLANRHKRGLSGGRNTAMEAARGELVAFLDDDAIADPDWLAHMVSVYRQGKAMGVVSRVEPIWIGERPRWFPEEFYWAIGCSYHGQPKTTVKVRNLMGGAMIVERSLYERIGGFSDLIGRTGSFPISCEETEWCIRAGMVTPDSGFYFEPRAVIRHKVPAERLTWRYFTVRCFAEGLSKAYMTSLLRDHKALKTEGRFVLRTLPVGIYRGLVDAVWLDPSGLARAFAILIGLSCTAAAFLIGKGQVLTGAVDLREQVRHA